VGEISECCPLRYLSLVLETLRAFGGRNLREDEFHPSRLRDRSTCHLAGGQWQSRSQNAERGNRLISRCDAADDDRHEGTESNQLEASQWVGKAKEHNLGARAAYVTPKKERFKDSLRLSAER
jgi:hypothetical protein